MKSNLIVLFLFINLLIIIESKRVIFYSQLAAKKNDPNSGEKVSQGQIIQAPDPKPENDCRRNQIRDKHNRCRKRV